MCSSVGVLSVQKDWISSFEEAYRHGILLCERRKNNNNAYFVVALARQKALLVKKMKKRKNNDVSYPLPQRPSCQHRDP